MERCEEYYLVDIRSCAKVSIAQERHLITLARVGDRQAREALICSLLPQVRAFAWRYHRLHLHESPVCSEAEYTAVGNLTLVEKFDEALSKENPCAYLLLTAYGAIKQHRLRHRSVICMPVGAPMDAYIVESLDAGRYRSSDEDDANDGTLFETLAQPPATQSSMDYTALHEALGQLTESTRTLLYRLFGLNGYGEESLTAIAGSWESQVYRAAMARKSWALTQLRKMLADHYPHLATSTRKGAQKAYERVRLSDAQRLRVDQAIAELQQRGERITVKQVRAVSRLNFAFVSARMSELRNTTPSSDTVKIGTEKGNR